MKSPVEHAAEINRAVTQVANAFTNAAGFFPAFSSYLDTLTRRHTVFSDFTELVNAEQGYFPSLLSAPAEYDRLEIVALDCDLNGTAELMYAELDLLAVAYDITQESRDDRRRVLRVPVKTSLAAGDWVGDMNKAKAGEHPVVTTFKYLTKHLKAAALFTAFGMTLIYIAHVILS